MTTTEPATKVAIVLDLALPPGLAANTAAVLALTLGFRVPNLLGPDLKDADGTLHLGITTVPIPILTTDAAGVKAIRSVALEEQLVVVDFTDAAQRTRTYDDYAGQLEQESAQSLAYLGIAIHGPKKKVLKLTGSLPLLR